MYKIDLEVDENRQSIGRLLSDKTPVNLFQIEPLKDQARVDKN